jgi:transmembrane sensor
MDDASHWNLLAKYLAGQTSDREVERLEVWIKADPVRRKVLDDALDAWNATAERSLDLDVSDAWDVLSDRIDQIEEETSPTPRLHNRRERAPKATARSTWQRVLRVAGGVALVIGAAVLVMMWIRSDPTIIATNRGERSSFELTDGTHVDLNADSKLTLSPEFGQGTRQVELEGEAFFDVTHVDGRPFRVHTSEGDVRVVGTAFNVHAYADEKEAQVVVSEGKVALGTASTTGAAHADTVVLEPRQLGVMADHRVRELQREVDLRPYTAWKEGRLVFEDATFSEVVRRLERWYNLEIDVQAPVAAIDQLNAVFEEETVREVISDIAIALDLKFEIRGSRITVWRREANAPPETTTQESPPTQNSTLLTN